MTNQYLQFHRGDLARNDEELREATERGKRNEGIGTPDNEHQTDATSRGISTVSSPDHERANGLSSEILRQKFAHYRAVVQHQYAVAKFEQFVEIFRHDEHPRAVITRFAQQ